MAGEKHYLYLTSLGNTDFFPHNQPHRIENRIIPPIHLDPNKDYEVGLINCFYLKQYLGLVTNDYACRIEIWTIAHVDETLMYKLHTYTPRTNTEVGDKGYMVGIINAELAEKLNSNMKTKYVRYFVSGYFFNYNEKTGRVERVFRKRQCKNDGHFFSLTVKFGSRMDQVLGFDYHAKYNLYSSYTEAENEFTLVPAPFPPRIDDGIDFALFYTDCVSPTIYDGQNVNLLEVITMEAAGRFSSGCM